MTYRSILRISAICLLSHSIVLAAQSPWCERDADVDRAVNYNSYGLAYDLKSNSSATVWAAEFCRDQVNEGILSRAITVKDALLVSLFLNDANPQSSTAAHAYFEQLAEDEAKSLADYSRDRMVVEAMENGAASATMFVAATGLNLEETRKRLEEQELLKIDQYCSVRSWRNIMYINAVQNLQDSTMALSYFQQSPIASVVEKAHACQANLEYAAVSSYGNMGAVFQFLLYYGYSPYPQVKEHALLQYKRTHETYKVNVGEHAQRDWFTQRRELPAVNAVFQQLR